MLDYVRNFTGVPKRGTRRVQIFTPQFAIIAPQYAGSQGTMDDAGQRSYRFSDASMTNHVALNWGHCRRSLRGLGGRNQIEVEVAEISRLGAPRRYRLCLALPGAITTLGNSAHAGGSLEARKQPMHFKWIACQPDCKGWVTAVGIVTSGQPEGVRRIRQESPARRRDHRAGFQRRLGQRFHRARPEIPQSRRTDHGRRHRAHANARTANARAWHRKRIASRCACSCCCRARRVTCRRSRMSACTRSGWAIAPTTPRPRATARRI